MRIGVLSGKGGTGKTTLVSNLSYVLGPKVMIDADVEEPNLNLFSKKEIAFKTPVKKKYPVINADTCLACGKCDEFCRFNALLATKNKVLVYKELCHACEGCALVCPTNSIRFKERVIGEIQEKQVSESTRLYSGVLNVGELSGVEIIKSLNQLNDDALILVDSPPGTSCATAEAIKNIDYAILVAETTIFGMSDLRMAIELLESRSIPFGVVLNKTGLGNDELSLYLSINKIQVLGEIPFDKKYALSYSEGLLLAVQYPEYYIMMEDIIKRLPFKLSPLKGGK